MNVSGAGIMRCPSGTSANHSNTGSEVPKIQGLLNELMTFLEDELSLITGAYNDRLSLDEVFVKELILFVSLKTNKNSKAVTALGRMLLQNMQLIIGSARNEQERRRQTLPMVSVILDEFAPFADPNFAQILQTARGTNTAFLFALHSPPQLLKVPRLQGRRLFGAQYSMLLHTRDEETAQYFLKASARVRQKRRTLTVQRTGVFEDKDDPIGFGSETDINETRAQDEHIKSRPVGQPEILTTDRLQGTLHSHLHVRAPRNYRFPGLEPTIYPRLHFLRILTGLTSASNTWIWCGATGASASEMGSWPEYEAFMSDCRCHTLDCDLVAFPGFRNPATRATTPPHMRSSQPRDGFLDYTLKRINPSDTNYGQCLGEGRTMLLEETVRNVYFWSNIVALGLLGCLFVIIVYQHRIQAKREWTTAEMVRQLDQSLSRSRAQVEEATQKNHHLMETLRALRIGFTISFVAYRSADCAALLQRNLAPPAHNLRHRQR